ncbi:hypothetical protein [Caldimonas brevitalea]|uniref:Uncharacterized protein n=1 Tax=Caldimonas brevitalea TaxID=413882 RepID=A0A0G3BDG2_9BURK|nr:hypothetical protein [Caldimonas brevitalea]AKJ27332.1 hypothetical protein AAW51_0641 [Caldimonas brevitalea]
MFDRIDALIKKHGFAFESWEDPSGKAVWAALLPSEEALDDVRVAACAERPQLRPAADFLASADWMPLTTASTFDKAVAKLEMLLACLPQEMRARDTTWSSAVTSALEHLRQLRQAAARRKTCDVSFDAMPASFEELVAEVRLGLRAANDCSQQH